MGLQNILTSLADTLARLYMTSSEIMMVATENQLQTILIDLSNNPRDNWWNVLQHACQNGVTFIQILEYALLDHQGNEQLIKLKSILQQIELDITTIMFNDITNDDNPSTEATLDDVSYFVDMKFKGHTTQEISNNFHQYKDLKVQKDAANDCAIIDTVNNSWNVTASLYDALFHQRMISNKGSLELEDIKHIKDANHRISPEILAAVNKFSFSRS